MVLKVYVKTRRTVKNLIDMQTEISKMDKKKSKKRCTTPFSSSEDFAEVGLLIKQESQSLRFFIKKIHLGSLMNMTNFDKLTTDFDDRHDG